MRNALIVGWLVGCSAKEEEPGTTSPTASEDPDGDADSDADADADTDADSDTDTGVIRTEPADPSGCVAVDETDDGANGSVERTTTVTYDDAGLLASAVVDDNDPDTAASTSFVYDADGNELERRFDNDGDGAVDDVHYRTWTATGYLSSYCVDYGDDGVCDYAERMTFEPGTDNRTLYEVDSDGDGLYESSCSYTYDGTDRRTGYVCVGPLDREAQYNYTGGTVWDYDLLVDFGTDGSVDQRESYRYDTEERLIYNAYDGNNNGVWDSEVDTSYNPDGTIALQAGSTVGPASTFRYEYTYDDEGYLVHLRFGVDVSGDGLPDQETVDDWTWTCP